MNKFMCSNNKENNLLFKAKNNKLCLSNFQFPNRHPSTENLVNQRNNLIIDEILKNKDDKFFSEIINEEDIKEKKIGEYNIQIIPTITKLATNEVFFIKNLETQKNCEQHLNIPKIKIDEFNKNQIELDENITKIIQKGGNYENIYNTMYNFLKKGD